MNDHATPPAGRDDLRLANLRIRIFGAVGGDPAKAQAVWEIVGPELEDAAPSDLPGSPSEPAPVRWNVCPDCSGRHPGGAACPHAPDEPAPSDLPGSPTAGSTADLRDRIAEALYRWTLDQAGGSNPRLLGRDEKILRENSLARADAVMAVVAPRLHTALCADIEADRDHWQQTAERMRTALEEIKLRTIQRDLHRLATTALDPLAKEESDRA